MTEPHLQDPFNNVLSIKALFGEGFYFFLSFNFNAYAFRHDKIF